MELFYEENRFYAMDTKGSLLAEITFPFTAPGKVDINHTFVDASLRGQGHCRFTHASGGREN
jgi:predicted GNAT family acetyltransferase